MPERSDIHLLCADISDAVERILLYTSEMTYREFILDVKTQDAIIRNLEISFPISVSNCRSTSFSFIYSIQAVSEEIDVPS